MNSKNIGDSGEDQAVEYLLGLNFKILNRNWKNRWCEIDIVAKKKQVVYFVEVKYRSNARYGSGIDAITHKKLSQMHFAAEQWVYANNWDGDYRIIVLSISSQGLEMLEL